MAVLGGLEIVIITAAILMFPIPICIVKSHRKNARSEQTQDTGETSQSMNTDKGSSLSSNFTGFSDYSIVEFESITDRKESFETNIAPIAQILRKETETTFLSYANIETSHSGGRKWQTREDDEVLDIDSENENNGDGNRKPGHESSDSKDGNQIDSTLEQDISIPSTMAIDSLLFSDRIEGAQERVQSVHTTLEQESEVEEQTVILAPLRLDNPRLDPAAKPFVPRRRSGFQLNPVTEPFIPSSHVRDDVENRH